MGRALAALIAGAVTTTAMLAFGRLFGRVLVTPEILRTPEGRRRRDRAWRWSCVGMGVLIAAIFFAVFAGGG